MGLPLRRDAGQLQHHRNHQPGHQRPRHVLRVLVGVLGQLPHQTGIQLLLIQGGFQVDDRLIGVLPKVPQVGAGAEHQRAGQAEVGEQQLPLLLELDLILPVLHLQNHIFQSEALHART